LSRLTPRGLRLAQQLSSRKLDRLSKSEALAVLAAHGRMIMARGPMKEWRKQPDLIAATEKRYQQDVGAILLRRASRYPYAKGDSHRRAYLKVG
jgi:hypothetical protein